MADSLLPLWIQEYQKHCRKAENGATEDEKKKSGDVTPPKSRVQTLVIKE